MLDPVEEMVADYICNNWTIDRTVILSVTEIFPLYLSTVRNFLKGITFAVKSRVLEKLTLRHHLELADKVNRKAVGSYLNL